MPVKKITKKSTSGNKIELKEKIKPAKKIIVKKIKILEQEKKDKIAKKEEPMEKHEIVKKIKKEEKPVSAEAKLASAKSFGKVLSLSKGEVLSLSKGKVLSLPKDEVKPVGTKAIWATGRRKNAIAVIRLSPGQGDILINGKLTLNNYLPWIEWQQIVLSPLNCLGEEKNFQVLIRVQGGGKKGQSEAIRLGLSKALSYFNPEWRSKLKSFGYLTRDARVKERKKPGLKRARRAPQWQKR